ncbi:hypothetical protein ACMUMQ_05880 [Marinomonas sp. 2405UD66-6]
MPHRIFWLCGFYRTNPNT